uniref:Transmembrane protein n=1 Tax=Eutreptiella gymnastica TaxID=73025 RepID=A0A7S4FVS9_9EUGL|mmetsp:Transcript_20769/g.33008  ORF Transcript_20769/g.33008 Transcript_20769/m.33008 type:complete len:213 (+) Transcript_20769:61-699(+)|eukprot:CAMPEP_0174367494 /NCGR_PEP_ID=MMETSP0811_2-20130205/85535_1 /TAXON_ID=73025 ORGANISM="Eutreptiella gymnastica-like, Strain CCMP1594" /NCGR_SAMPLE_ID=MMETSP0811_2 /ASSEMBLY_ACC=CAM_ASM_000667 /LENGTH=212 /DNA_ID=CAMNT_0015510113 /DNA_START=61 /DNA_END=699 /DNA_ORIENTATION=-
MRVWTLALFYCLLVHQCSASIATNGQQVTETASGPLPHAKPVVGAEGAAEPVSGAHLETTFQPQDPSAASQTQRRTQHHTPPPRGKQEKAPWYVQLVVVTGVLVPSFFIRYYQRRKTYERRAKKREAFEKALEEELGKVDADIIKQQFRKEGKSIIGFETRRAAPPGEEPVTREVLLAASRPPLPVDNPDELPHKSLLTQRRPIVPSGPADE